MQRAGLHPGVELRAHDWNGEPIGATALATVGGRYMTADMGVFRVGDAVPASAAITVSAPPTACRRG